MTLSRQIIRKIEMDQVEVRNGLKVFLDKGFDYEESLKSVSFKHEDVIKLKQQLEQVPIVPIVHDKLVC